MTEIQLKRRTVPQIMEYISRAEMPEGQKITEIWTTYYPGANKYGAGAMIHNGVRYLGEGLTAEIALSFLMANIAAGSHFVEEEANGQTDY